MPYILRLADNATGWLQTGSGILTGQEIYQAVYSIANDHDNYLKVRYGLIDLTAVTQTEITGEDVRRIAEVFQDKSHLITTLYHAFVTDKPLLYGLARMYEEYSTAAGWEFKIVQTVDEAKAFIREGLGDHITFKPDDESQHQGSGFNV